MPSFALRNPYLIIVGALIITAPAELAGTE